MCELTLDVLKSAVSGTAAAFRCVTEYQPAGGPGDKVFPPTYEGGKYATEKRFVPGREAPVDCVLLDSVQSQANRMELALLDAWEAGRLELPVIVVNFNDARLEKQIRVTSLDAPHRIADAILRDSFDGTGERRKLFRQSERGKRLDMVDLRNATALLEMCPTALIFGMWDSTGPKGGLGAKFQRALVSEIVGYDAIPGVKTSSRIDPLMIRLDKDGGTTTVYEAKTELGWTLNPKHAVPDKDGKPKQYGEGKKAGKPSSLNHGNIPPDLVVRKDKNDRPVLERPDARTPVLLITDGRPRTHILALDESERAVPIGGFTISKAEQRTTLSLPALRRLCFPTKQEVQDEANRAARTALAALGLCAATLAREGGCDLRSRCQLVPTTPFVWQLLDQPGEPANYYSLSAGASVALLNAAVGELRKVLPTAWPKEPIQLTASDELQELVVRSQRLAASGKGESAGAEE
ncbi:MAG: type I-U CRISPR-associated protein Cas7 [Phycisphaerae bacterium]|nr:type I-U CRISPR-associated protein Cas7 [Phycisphaerae bacterium]